mgnify:CR=1 FL=1
MDLKFERRTAQQLTIHLDHDIGRGFDADMTTTIVLDVADTINIAIEESAQTEENLPPVHRAIECKVEQTIIGTILPLDNTYTH